MTLGRQTRPLRSPPNARLRRPHPKSRPPRTHRAVELDDVTWIVARGHVLRGLRFERGPFGYDVTEVQPTAWERHQVALVCSEAA